MIGTIRKHSQALWWIVIIVIILAFVVWDTRQGNDQGGGNSNLGTMNGHPITPTLYEQTKREVLLYHLFRAGNFPDRGGRTIPGFDVEKETYYRIFLILHAQEQGIQISDELAGKAAADRLRLVGNGQPVPYDQFEKQILAPERLTIDDFSRFCRNSLAIDQLIAAVGLTGQLIPPQEVEALYRRDQQEMAVQVAFFHAASNLNSVVVTPEKLGEFYTNQMARYRLPERAQVSYVHYPITNYLAAAQQKLAAITNLNDLLEERLVQLGTNYLSVAATPEAAKAKLREEYLKSTALMAANDDAKKFDNQLFDSKTPVTPELFATLAQAAGLRPQVSAPFTRDEAPAGMDVGPNFPRQAYHLTADEPLTEPLVSESGIYVVAYNKILPSESPSFETVKARVTEDYRFMESARKAGQAGMDFQASATNGLAAGKSFAELCAKAGVKPVKLSPLALSTRSVPEIEGQMDLSMLKRVVFATAPGQVGPVLPSADGAAVVFVEAKLPLNEAQMRTNLPAFTREVHQVRRGEAFNAWFSREFDQARRTVTYFQKEAQLQSAPTN